MTAGLLVGMGQAGAGQAIAMGAVARLVPEERRTWALGIATMGGSAGIVVTIPIAQYVLNQFGWSDGYVVLALLPPGGLAFAVIYDIVGSLITWTVGPPLISGARFSGRSLMGYLGRSPSVQGMALAVVVQLTPVAPLMATSLWWPARAVIVLALSLIHI